MKFIPYLNGRNAFIGFMSSIVSDTVSNFMRVIKTTKQALAARGEDIEYGTRSKRATYAEAIGIILAADGWRGLFGRGLKTRIFANAVQSIVFTVIWRGLTERWSPQDSQQAQNIDVIHQTTDDESYDDYKYTDNTDEAQ